MGIEATRRTNGGFEVCEPEELVCEPEEAQVCEPEPEPVCEWTFEEEVLSLLQHPVYEGLPEADQAQVFRILELATSSRRGWYYTQKLRQLLDTPNAPAAVTSAKQTKQLEASVGQVKIAQQREGFFQRLVRETLEERVTALQAGDWQRYRVDGGPVVLIKNQDPTQLAIRLEVHVDADPAQVRRVRALEDAIEKQLAIPGFTVDLRFVDQPGDGVFSVKADPTGWTTSHNWVGSAKDLAHELMHLLGLPDEYDYIESHATNRHMQMSTRLHWFLVQMQREVPPDAARGIMSSGRNKPLERHACQAARLPIDPCVRARAGVQIRR